jgi:hypothetical protein
MFEEIKNRFGLKDGDLPFLMAAIRHIADRRRRKENARPADRFGGSGRPDSGSDFCPVVGYGKE